MSVAAEEPVGRERDGEIAGLEAASAAPGAAEAGQQRLADAFAAWRLGAALDGVSALELELLLPELATSAPPGWAHTGAAPLVAQGEASTVVAPLLQRVVVPQLPGLAARLAAPAAAFLDVGVGVAALALAVAQLWPALRVVGIDPWPPAINLAAQGVAAAGLSSRVALRCQGVEDLDDDQAFDLAWVAAQFVPDAALDPGLPRVRRALRLGGWAVCGVVNPAGDPSAVALGHLRTITWIGRPRFPGDLEAALRGAGFDEVRTLPSPAWAPVVAVVGQRTC